MSAAPTESNPQAVPLVGPSQRALVLGRVSIFAATSGDEGSSNLMRAVGCRLSDPAVSAPLASGASTPSLRISVFLTRSSSLPLLQDVAANGQIATVFSEPTTARTLQLKGTDAVVEELQPGDVDIVRAYVEKMVVEICSMGYTEALVRGVLAFKEDDLVALGFTPTACFEQTPGPLAGQALGQPGEAAA